MKIEDKLNAIISDSRTKVEFQELDLDATAEVISYGDLMLPQNLKVKLLWLLPRFSSCYRSREVIYIQRDLRFKNSIVRAASPSGNRD